MPSTIRCRWPCATLGLWLAGAMPGHADGRVDITEIYEQFVMAGAAAGRCDSGQAELDQSWSANFRAVLLRSIRAVRERNPGIPESRIDAALQNRASQLRASVESLIDREGCTSPDGRQLQRLYRVQASVPLP